MRLELDTTKLVLLFFLCNYQLQVVPFNAPAVIYFFFEIGAQVRTQTFINTFINTLQFTITSRKLLQLPDSRYRNADINRCFSTIFLKSKTEKI